MSKHHYSPSQMRSNSMNPNNSSYNASVANRANQLNPCHDAYSPIGGKTTANDVRSKSMNPNNASYHASVANRANQLNNKK